jgi:hypothetical protein
MPRHSAARRNKVRPHHVNVSDDVLYSPRYRDDTHIAHELGEHIIPSEPWFPDVELRADNFLPRLISNPTVAIPITVGALSGAAMGGGRGLLAGLRPIPMGMFPGWLARGCCR